MGISVVPALLNTRIRRPECAWGPIFRGPETASTGITVLGCTHLQGSPFGVVPLFQYFGLLSPSTIVK